MDSRLDQRVYVLVPVTDEGPPSYPSEPASALVLQFGSARELVTIQEAFRARP